MTPIRLIFRRAAVVAAAGLSLTVGGIAVRAAAAWTAAEAPLNAAPLSVTTLAQQLADEQARSVALQNQLSALTSQSGDLSAALKGARARAVADAREAKALQGRLAAARRTPAASARLTVAPTTGRSGQTAAIPTPTAPPVQATTGASGATGGGGEKEGGDD